MVIEQILTVRRGLATLLAAQGDHAAAAAELEKALALAPADQRPALLMRLACEQRANGQVVAARASAGQALNDPASRDQALEFLNRLDP